MVLSMMNVEFFKDTLPYINDKGLLKNMYAAIHSVISFFALLRGNHDFHFEKSLEILFLAHSLFFRTSKLGSSSFSFLVLLISVMNYLNSNFEKYFKKLNA